MKMPYESVGQFRHYRTTVVLVDTFHEEFDSLTVKNQEGAYAATRHLVSLGHKRNGMLAANRGSFPAKERLRGFREAKEKAGLPIEPSFVKNSSFPKLDGFTRESGYEVMNQFLGAGGRNADSVFRVK